MQVGGYRTLGAGKIYHPDVCEGAAVGEQSAAWSEPYYHAPCISLGCVCTVVVLLLRSSRFALRSSRFALRALHFALLLLSFFVLFFFFFIFIFFFFVRWSAPFSRVFSPSSLRGLLAASRPFIQPPSSSRGVLSAPARPPPHRFSRASPTSADRPCARHARARTHARALARSSIYNGTCYEDYPGPLPMGPGGKVMSTYANATPGAEADMPDAMIAARAVAALRNLSAAAAAAPPTKASAAQQPWFLAVGLHKVHARA